eukprot:g13087.t1
MDSIALLKQKASRAKMRARKSLMAVKEIKRNKSSIETFRKRHKNEVHTFAHTFKSVETTAETLLNYRVLFWAVCIHLFFPFSLPYVYFIDGPIVLKNLQFGFHEKYFILTTHIALSLPLACLIWAIYNPVLMEVFGAEILIMWLAHFSRIIGVGIKYAYTDEAHLFEYFHCQDIKTLQTASNDLMLPSGWYQPTLLQWLPIIDRSEHVANADLSLQGMTVGQGLSQHIDIIGESNIKIVEEMINDIKDHPELIQRHFTISYGTKKTEKFEITKTFENVRCMHISIGLLLMGICNSEEVNKKKTMSIKRLFAESMGLALFYSQIGGMFRTSRGIGYGGGIRVPLVTSCFFMFSITLVIFFNFFAFFNFLKIAVADYQRRKRMCLKLMNMIHPSLKKHDSVKGAPPFTVEPKMIDLRQGKNAMSYLISRQVMRQLGLSFRLRLQWLISYGLVMYTIMFAVLAELAVSYIFQALSAANEANMTPESEINLIRIQTLEAHGDAYTNLAISDSHDMENLHLFEMHKLIISYMETMVEFIKHDDERNPIKVLNVRADWKLLQGFVATIIGGVATLLELSGVDWKGFVRQRLHS